MNVGTHYLPIETNVLDPKTEFWCKVSASIYDIKNVWLVERPLSAYLSLLIVTYCGFSLRSAFTSSRPSRPSFCGFTGRFLYKDVYLQCEQNVILSNGQPRQAYFANVYLGGASLKNAYFKFLNGE
jgi:hypothetical protein